MPSFSRWQDDLARLADRHPLAITIDRAPELVADSALHDAYDNRRYRDVVELVDSSGREDAIAQLLKASSCLILGDAQRAVDCAARGIDQTNGESLRATGLWIQANAYITAGNVSAARGRLRELTRYPTEYDARARSLLEKLPDH